jgi:hypothetical protein
MSTQPHPSVQSSTGHSPRSFKGDLPTPYPRHIEEFQALYKQRFGISLSSQQALPQLISLLLIANYRQQNAAHKAKQKSK